MKEHFKVILMMIVIVLLIIVSLQFLAPILGFRLPNYFNLTQTYIQFIGTPTTPREETFGPTFPPPLEGNGLQAVFVGRGIFSNFPFPDNYAIDSFVTIKRTVFDKDPPIDLSDFMVTRVNMPNKVITGKDDKFYDYYWMATISGKMIIPASGNYKFHLSCKDGCTLYINNQRIINEWHDVNTPTQYVSSPISFAAGGYPLLIQHYVNDGPERLYLEWESDTGITVQPVPKKYLSYVYQLDPSV